MCFPPLVLAGIALAAGGDGMNYIGQQKAQHAMTNTFNRERERQKGFEQEQVGKFQNSLDSTRQVTDPNAQAAAADKRTAFLSALTRSASPAAGGYAMPGSGNAPQMVATAADAAGAKADAQTAGLAKALGALGGMDDQMLTNNINIGRNSQDIGQIGGFARGSMDVLQSEMDAAKQKGATWRTLGGLAQSIGSAMLSGGIGGGAGAGGGAINPGGATAAFFGGGRNPFAFSGAT